jgi:hypothetical protein
MSKDPLTAGLLAKSTRLKKKLDSALDFAGQMPEVEGMLCGNLATVTQEQSQANAPAYLEESPVVTEWVDWQNRFQAMRIRKRCFA